LFRNGANDYLKTRVTEFACFQLREAQRIICNGRALENIESEISLRTAARGVIASSDELLREKLCLLRKVQLAREVESYDPTMKAIRDAFSHSFHCFHPASFMDFVSNTSRKLDPYLTTQVLDFPPDLFVIYEDIRRYAPSAMDAASTKLKMKIGLLRERR